MVATIPQRESDQRPEWSGKRQRMTEEAYRELECLSPDHKYEYLDGVASMMSGGSVAHDRITRPISFALDRQRGDGPCSLFGVDAQVLIGSKKTRMTFFSGVDDPEE